MKKLLLLLSVFGIIAVPMIGQTVYAQYNLFKDTCTGEAANSPACIDAKKTQTATDNGIYGSNGILNKVVNLLGIVIGIAAVIAVIIGGIKYILAAGDSAKINSAKDTILYALIGLVVAIIAPLLIKLIARAIL